MATEKVKVYEEQEKKYPMWYWLLPLLLLLAALAWYMMRNRNVETAVSATPVPVETQQAKQQIPPVLGALPVLGEVHFDTDKATLTSEGQATLAHAAEVMKERPNIHLRLEGYTDSTGTASHNDVLSQQRALAVEHFLEGKGIPKARLTGEGFGQANPTASNATTQGKADNRRVELFQQ